MVGRGLDHTRVTRDSRNALLAEELDVVRLVGEALDGERVDLQAAGGEVALGRVLHLLEQLLAVADELLDGQRADDRPERSFQHVLDDRVDLFWLGVEESLCGIAQRFDVTSDLEGGDALDLDFDALAGHSVRQLHADLARSQLELADAVEQRPDERTATDDDFHTLVSRACDHLAALVTHFRAARPGDDERLVGARDVVAAGDEGDQQQEYDHPCHD